jgi:hypothetical protein
MSLFKKGNNNNFIENKMNQLNLNLKRLNKNNKAEFTGGGRGGRQC